MGGFGDAVVVQPVLRSARSRAHKLRVCASWKDAAKAAATTVVECSRRVLSEDRTKKGLAYVTAEDEFCKQWLRLP